MGCFDGIKEKIHNVAVVSFLVLFMIASHFLRFSYIIGAPDEEMSSITVQVLDWISMVLLCGPVFLIFGIELSALWGRGTTNHVKHGTPKKIAKMVIAGFAAGYVVITLLLNNAHLYAPDTPDLDRNLRIARWAWFATLALIVGIGASIKTILKCRKVGPAGPV